MTSSSSSSTFYVHFSMHARVGRFPHIAPLHLTRSSAQYLSKPRRSMSFFTHSFQVFLLLPFRLTPSTSKFRQADTQSLSHLRSRCPNHLSLPLLTTSATASTFKRLYNSLLDILFFSVTPHIHRTIIFSALSNLNRSSIYLFSTE